MTTIPRLSHRLHCRMVSIYLLQVLLLWLASRNTALVDKTTRKNVHSCEIPRRDVLFQTVVSTFASAPLVAMSTPSNAAAVQDGNSGIDMDAIQAARAKGPTTSLSDLFGTTNTVPETIKNNNGKVDQQVDMDKINAVRSTTFRKPAQRRGVSPVVDPPPQLLIVASPRGSTTIPIPRVGYSLYKTSPDLAARCTALALRAGVRHFDVGTDYGSNSQVAVALKSYLDNGISGLTRVSEEKPQLIDLLDATSKAGEDHANAIRGNPASASFSPAPLGSIGRRGRRDELFVSHKVSNMEQSTDATSVRRAVKAAIKTLGCSYLDMVSIHSPLTDSSRRLATYEALLSLQASGLVKSVGVCNYGLGPLQEISNAQLELPSVNQLELSPFNQHRDVVEWCDANGIAIGCSAWSRLSSADGPTEGWDIVAKLALEKKMTKAQILVRWALQKGYICVPRSASSSKVERIAIAENSYGGVNRDPLFVLTTEEMQLLDSLDISYPAGTLGRRDGWVDLDVTGRDWDPTNYS